MRAFLLALQFLTVITIKRDLAAEEGDLARARNWFAVVGLILGGILAAAAWGLGRILAPLPLAALMVFLWAGLSRFLHLDGLADSADALVYPSPRRRALEIMKDTRVGSFGICAIACLLLIKFAALAALAQEQPLRLAAGLVLAPVLGRAAAAWLSALLPPAAAQGLGAATGARRSLMPLPATGLVALAACLAAGTAGLAALLVVMLLGLGLGAWFMRRLGGVTGDSLGAAIELSEALALVVLGGIWA